MKLISCATVLSRATVVVAALAAHSLCAQDVQLLTASDPALDASGGGGDSWTPLVSRDGRCVLFCSTANNLMLASNNLPIPGVFPPSLNVFLRDRTSATTTLVSVNSSGVAGGNGHSLPVDISTNNQYVLFESEASDLVRGDTNRLRDVFVRDLVNGVTVLVSAATNGVVGNGASSSPVMTPDGRYVAFVSAANNLVPGDTNGTADVFVRDLLNHTTVLASPGALYPRLNFGLQSENPEISDDGRYVAFFSQGTNLVPGVTGRGDVYVRDLAADTTLWASAAGRAQMTSTNVMCFNHALSADGRFVAYEAADLGGTNNSIFRYEIQTGQTLTVDTNAAFSRSLERVTTLDMSADGRFIAYVANAYDTSGTNTCIRLWDAQTGQSTLASGDPGGSVAPNTVCDWPTVDPSGRYVGFLSTAPGLVTNALAGSYHLYLRDMQAGTTLLLDYDTNNAGAGVSAATVPRLSADARLVALEGNDGNLVAGDRNHAWDVFLRDLGTGNVGLISAREATLPSATPNGPSAITPYSMSRDGRWLAFSSTADNLVPDDTNGWRDVFVRDVYNGLTTLVSAATNRGPGNNMSFEPAISPDGRYVAFTSSADNLSVGLGTRKQQVFLRDLQTGATKLVSANTNGTAANGDCFGPMVSPAGRFVLFGSKALDLIGGLFPSRTYYFLRNVLRGENYLLSISSFDYAPVTPAVTPDWRFVVVAGVLSTTNSSTVVRVWDVENAQFVFDSPASPFYASQVLAIAPSGTRVAYSSSSSAAYVCDVTNAAQRLLQGASGIKGMQFSEDGRFLASVQGGSHIYYYDLLNWTNPGSPTLVDYAVTPPSRIIAGNGASDAASISPDGRFIVYRSSATNLVAGDTNGFPDVFIYDRLSDKNRLLSVSANGQFPNQFSSTPVLTADGKTVLFTGGASDFAANDFNYDRDIFAYPFFYAVLLTGSLPDQGPWVSWPFAPGRNYRVEYQDALGTSGWQDLGGSISNFVGRAYLQDPSPNTGQRLYRVISY